MTPSRLPIRRRSARFGRLVALAAVLATGVTVRGDAPDAQDLLGDSFTGPSSTAPVRIVNVNADAYPCLTAGPAGADPSSTIPNCGLASPDPVGQGALRFTGDVEQQASAIAYDTDLPTSKGLSITFKQYQYGGHGLGGPGDPGGADGISFFLAVAPPPPPTLGPQGGALGYASADSTPGLPGAWLGIGFDAFGNFANPFFGSPSCPVPGWAAGLLPNQITVRGPGNGLDGYCLLSSSIERGSDNPVGDFGASLRGDNRASSARSIRIVIDPLTNTYEVSIDPQGGTDFVPATSGPLPASYFDPVTGQEVTGIPPRITFGFAASTGSATDIHEITSLAAETTNGGVPVLALAKTTDLPAPKQGDTFNYVITPSVAGNVDESEPLSIHVTDMLPDGVSATGGPFGDSWSCATTSPIAFDCAYLAAATIPAGTTLPSIFIPVRLDTAPAGAVIVNTAHVRSDDAATPVQAIAAFSIPAISPVTVTTSSLPTTEVDAAYTPPMLAATGGTPGYTWALDSGSLPPGITLATSGQLSGPATASGTFSFVVRATDTAGTVGTRSLSIVVATKLDISTTSLTPGTKGEAYQAPVDTTGGVGTKTWSISGGALPDGLTLNASGVVIGTPTATGSFNATVHVTDALGIVATKAFSLLIASPVTVDTPSLPAGRATVPYSVPLSASGGASPYQWSIASGGLPAGLSLSPGGVVAGTPTAASTTTVQVRATDTAGRSGVRSYTVTITQLTIVTSSLPAAVVGQAYTSPAMVTSGAVGSVAWSLNGGGTPAGLTLSLLGVVSGIPTAAGSFAINVRATDSGSAFATRSIPIVVNPALTITTSSLPGGAVNSPYLTMLAATGGVTPYRWSLASGAVPGMTLDSGGVLSGTPTAAGTFALVVRVTDARGISTTRSLTVNIGLLSITTTALGDGTALSLYNTRLTATGGTGALRWGIVSGRLPLGVLLLPNGQLTGIPLNTGTFTVTIGVTDGAGHTATRQISLKIIPFPPVVTTLALPAGERTIPYVVTLDAAGGVAPLTWSLASGSLPPGLSLSAGGTIAGTPTLAGSRTFTVRVADTIGRSSTRSFSLSIVPSLAVTTASLPAGRVGAAYSATLSRSGGVAPFSWSIAGGALPDGLSLSPGGGITGTPSVSGVFSVTVQVSDLTGGSAARSLAITVAPAPEKAYVGMSTLQRSECYAWAPCSLQVVDLTSGQLLKTLPVQTSPFSMVASRDGSRVYLLDAASISVVDTRTDAVTYYSTGGITMNRQPAVSPDGTRLYTVLNLSAPFAPHYAIRVWDTATFGVIADFDLGNYAPSSLAISPDGWLLYAIATSTVINQPIGSPELLTIYAGSGAILSTLPLGVNAAGPLSLTPNGGRLLAGFSAGSANGLLDISVSSNAVADQIGLIGYPGGLAVPDDTRVFALESGTGAITEISLVSNSIVQRTSLAPIPQTSLFAGGGGGPLVNGTHTVLYWSVGGQVQRISLSGGSVTNVVNVLMSNRYAMGFAVAGAP